MRLFLLRHADADASGSVADSERPLSAAGIEEAHAVADALRHMKITFGIVLSSPFLRARQTAEIVATQIPSVRVQILEQIQSGSDPENLFRELQSLPRDTRTLVVSHEPFVSRCIGRLISAGNEPNISIKKASLSCVEVGSPVRPGSGVLLWLLTNEQLRFMKS
jgi:phosphohistidine phosphatase